MTQNPQQRLPNGLASLTDGRLGSNPRIGNRTESGYLVSNDGVQTMDLPRNMLGPRPANQGGRQTPVLIPPMKYIVYNNPQVCYDFLINKGYTVEPNIPSTYQFSREFVKDNGDPGVLEFVKNCHPDKDTLIKALGLDKKESNFDDAPANTQTSTTPVQTTPVAKEDTQVEKAGDWIKVNQKTIIIILVIVVFFLLINRASK